MRRPLGAIAESLGAGRDCGISHVTAREWLSVLETSYLVALLRPYHRNFGKRLTKSPKLYFLDVGLMAYLLGIRDPDIWPPTPSAAPFRNLGGLEAVNNPSMRTACRPSFLAGP